MPRAGRPPTPRGVFSFEASSWAVPEAVVLDASVVVSALVPSQEAHKACLGFFEKVAAADAHVHFNRQLEIEFLEAVFRLALKERWGRSSWERYRFDGRARRRASRLLDQAHEAWQRLLAGVSWTCVSVDAVADQVPRLMRAYGLSSYDAIHTATALSQGVPDVATRDADFARVPANVLTLHTTSARVAAFRELRS